LMKFWVVSPARKFFYARLTAIGFDVVRINNEVNLRARDMARYEGLFWIGKVAYELRHLH
jgi:hypothetical protein